MLAHQHAGYAMNRQEIATKVCMQAGEKHTFHRSDVSRLAILGILGFPTLSNAYCPPNCREGEEPATIQPAAPPAAEEPAVAESKIDLSKPESQSLARITDRVFFDISFGGKNRSRIVVGLYGDVVPKTVENFKLLATGAKGYGYNGTEFFRVVPGLQVSAGDILGNLGRSGRSALTGGTFEQENFRLLHTVPYTLSMMNTLDKEVDSRFFISTRPDADPGYSKIFDNKYVLFGRVVEGAETLRAIDQVEIRSGKGVNSGRPKEPLTIVDCGILK